MHPSLNQQHLRQGSMPTQPQIASDSLLSAGNYPLLNPSATALRNLPMQSNRGSDPFANPFLSSASQSSLGSYLEPSFSSHAGLLGQGLWTNEAAQAQFQAQAQLQAQAQAQVAALRSPQRGLLLGGQHGLSTVAAQQASQLPNLPISVASPSSFALPPETRFLQDLQLQQQQQQQQTIKSAHMSANALPDAGPGTDSTLTGRPPVVLYMPCDDAVISRLVFCSEATFKDLSLN